MYFNMPFMCAKFQLDWCMHLWFMAKNTKCAKWWWRRKNKEIKMEVLFARTLRLAGVICFKFGMQSHLPCENLCKIWFNLDNRYWSYIGMKVNMVCWLLGPHNTLLCVFSTFWTLKSCIHHIVYIYSSC